MKGARQMPGVLVKMPIELKEQIQDAAQRRFRSMNAEIVRRLAESLEKENAPVVAATEASYSK
ncbi:hypothetical protein ACUXAV_000330 [Cupriavidus metallidurans]|uniref:Arc family DNA-binding protein n=1 Tax=Cupriavidus metallidurans TaxID=119219 RepID=UPI000493ABB5|nr:Arc family DNA-binding protein [Cupriavidus metallidurans]MDE4918291.1 Arc family DNA-binding protein [Cupriavidus metallidurans]